MSDLPYLRDLLSQNGGQNDALLAIVMSICELIEPDSPLAQRIVLRLEQAYASKLQAVTNEAYFQGYQTTMDLAKMALQERPSGHAQGPDRS